MYIELSYILAKYAPMYPHILQYKPRYLAVSPYNITLKCYFSSPERALGFGKIYGNGTDIEIYLSISRIESPFTATSTEFKMS